MVKIDFTSFKELNMQIIHKHNIVPKTKVVLYIDRKMKVHDKARDFGDLDKQSHQQ